MKLSKIKLAGFKSFVDPATFHVPSSLVGIVGPNGCGKSNIIDAVRWVMGESSAKHLRGDSMADVIFGGSSTRKPVGQAHVELVFENNAGKLTGPWAAYTEIAIKRQVTRDGQSTYYINGTKCRRRDITDIFLGTGLGPRSYAIIEQGMISRVIEAKPAELRVFFEEAAGISKYKERRRETETRIRHTRENLERLTDLREEMDKRLQHLNRQAKVAEQYKQLREDERQTKAELYALRCRLLDQAIAEQERNLAAGQTALEAIIAEQRNLEAQIEQSRDSRGELEETLSTAQARFYQVGAEIARLEQAQQHQRELTSRRRSELEQITQDLTDVTRHLNEDETRAKQIGEALATREPEIEQATMLDEQASEMLATADSSMRDWQEQWEGFSTRSVEPSQLAQVQRTRMEHLERQLLQQQRRIERLKLERTELGEKSPLEELREREMQAAQLEETLEAEQNKLAELEQNIETQRANQRELGDSVNQARARLQSGKGRLASLEALQEAALGRNDKALNEWLNENSLEDKPRLGQTIKAQKGWERALEAALIVHLDAVCVDQIGTAQLDSLNNSDISLIEAGSKSAAASDALLNYVSADVSLGSVLAGARVASNIADALARRSDLSGAEYFVTADGELVGRNWLRVCRAEDSNAGVLVREQEIDQLRISLEQDETTEQEHAGSLERVREELRENEAARQEVQQRVNQIHREMSQAQAQVSALESRMAQDSEREKALAEEMDDLFGQNEENEKELSAARLLLEGALAAMSTMNIERETLQMQRETVRVSLDDTRASAREAGQKLQQLQMSAESERTMLASLEQALERLRARHEQLNERKSQLDADLSTDDDPVETIRAQLEELLVTRVEAESSLTEARHAAEAHDAELRKLEQGRGSHETRAQQQRESLEALRLSGGEAGVRRQNLIEQLAELEADLESVLETLPDEAAEDEWQARLEKLGSRIQRLGAINLAAIDEFAENSERKDYLDRQNDDLEEALNTLENAIAKIDRETRVKFKETFDKINEGVQRMFPLLFGGGNGHLALTEDDLLEAGVAIMAQPPGKRIGNINMMSGGEKALTAVALVFAIFELNPAPFCMLDEVDAPLDEANVGRFGKMVEAMSERVQFIFITHNKGTMEIARHLAGVTMHEPGVSRLVSVDVDEAVRLAAV